MATTALPFHLHEMYKSYKKATKTVVQWMSTASSCEVPDITSLSLWTLLQLADTARDAKVKVPSEIAAAFRETISSRKHIGEYYRQHVTTEDGRNSFLRHEKFTETMQIAYDMLIESPKSRAKRSKTKFKPRADDIKPIKHVAGKEKTEIASSPSPNRFAPLGTIMEKVEVHQNTKTTTVTPLTVRSNNKPTGVPKLSTKAAMAQQPYLDDLILDDEFESMTGVCLALAQLDVILCVVKDVFSLAARDEIPFSVASMMTIASIHWSHRYTSYLESRLDGIRNGYNALDAFNLKPSNILSYRMSKILGGYAECNTGPGLTTTARACLSIGPPRPPKLVAERCRLSHSMSKSLRDEESDLQYLEKLRDIGNTYGFEDGLSTSAVELTNGWMRKIMSGSGTFDDAFGLRMILEAQRSYLWALITRPSLRRNVLNPRHRVERFAKEAFISISRVIGSPWMASCNCSSPRELHRHYQGFASFVKSSRYDLLTQNAMIAGCTMIELMHVTHTLGTSFMSYAQHVPGLLHIYSIVHQRKKCAPVPVLENLCSILKKPVFLGERPWKNFSTCFVRYLGGKLSFSKRRDVSSFRYGSNEKWQMTLPDSLFMHTGKCRIEANFKRFEDNVDAGLFWETCKDGNLETVYWSKVLVKSNDSSLLLSSSNKLIEVDDWLQDAVKYSKSPLRLLQGIFIEELGRSRKELTKVVTAPSTSSKLHAVDPDEPEKTHGAEGFGSQDPHSVHKKRVRTPLTGLPIGNINWLALWSEVIKLVQEVRVELFKDTNPVLDPYDFVLMVTDFVEAADHVCKNRGCRCIRDGFGKDSEAWGLAFDKLAELPSETFVWKAI